MPVPVPVPALDNPSPVREVSAMQPSPKNQPPEETTALGTLAWVGAVVALAIVALLILSALGPVGEH
jgi:hypothetical protein